MHLRLFLIGLLLAALATAASLVAFARPAQPGGSDRQGSEGHRVAEVADRPARPDPAVAVLQAWDRRRAAAWAAGDVAALGRLYVPGSVAGRRDRRMLGAYVDRGLRVTGLRMQYLAVRVRHRGPRVVVVVVTDRVVDAVAVGSGRRVPLPRDGPSRRRIVLRQAAGEPGGQWRVVSVRTPRDRWPVPP